MKFKLYVPPTCQKVLCITKLFPQSCTNVGNILNLWGVQSQTFAKFCLTTLTNEDGSDLHDMPVFFLKTAEIYFLTLETSKELTFTVIHNMFGE